MNPFQNCVVVGRVALVAMLLASTAALLLSPVGGARVADSSGAHALGLGAPHASLSGSTFVAAPPVGAKGPDDITSLAVDGVDHGRLVVWIAYQNGINPNGTPGSSGGPTRSTIAGYDAVSGATVRSLNITGKIDGMTSFPARDLLLATVNEDANSAFDVIYPALGAVATYTYSPSPEVSGNGGTDSIAIHNDHIYVTHSNPNDTSQAAEFLVTLHIATLTAQLTPVFYDNSNATDVPAHQTVQLGLTDPDTSSVMPGVSPRFAGTLVTISQADGKIIFASHLSSTVKLHELNLSDNVSGNVPPIDGFAVATCSSGTLYAVDASAGITYAFNTSGWPAGTVFVGEPKDTGNPILGTLNLFTGKITPFTNHLVSPKGLLFVPHHCTIADQDDGSDDGGHDGGHDGGQGGDDQGDHGDRGTGWEPSRLLAVRL
ncbi:MAG: hypothetical protein L3K13_04345 [Thermoplasmata archaeon]|nr:hypothetical protein [Thermoplasmata archaeon]